MKRKSYKTLYLASMERVKELEAQIKTMETEFEEKCKREQIDRLIQEFEVPMYLLQTDLAKQAIKNGDLDKIRRILTHRAILMRPKLRLVENSNKDEGDDLSDGRQN